VGIFGLGAVAFLVLAISAGGLFFWASSQPQPANAQPPVVRPATITPTATRAYAAELAVAQSWPLWISDPFDDNHNGWPTDSDSSSTGSHAKRIEAGEYLVRYLKTDGGTLTWNISEVPSFDFSRFAVSVDVDLSSPQSLGCAGIMLQNSDDHNYIYTCFFDNGNYRIHENRDGAWNHMATDNYPGVAPDRSNRLTLIGLDGAYLLYIDGQFVDRVESDLLSEGKVYLLVGVEANDEITVSFDDFEIRLPTGSVSNQPSQPDQGAPTVSVSKDTNCRTGPGQPHPSVGGLAVGETAEVVGVSPGGDFWIIKNPDNIGTTCWLWKQYATVTGDTSGLPVIQPPPTPYIVVSPDPVPQGALWRLEGYNFPPGLTIEIKYSMKVGDSWNFLGQVNASIGADGKFQLSETNFVGEPTQFQFGAYFGGQLIASVVCIMEGP
jgi:hypothetical protein